MLKYVPAIISKLFLVFRCNQPDKRSHFYVPEIPQNSNTFYAGYTNIQTPLQLHSQSLTPSPVYVPSANPPCKPPFVVIHFFIKLWALLVPTIITTSPTPSCIPPVTPSTTHFVTSPTTCPTFPSPISKTTLPRYRLDLPNRSSVSIPCAKLLCIILCSRSNS